MAVNEPRTADELEQRRIWQSRCPVLLARSEIAEAALREIVRIAEDDGGRQGRAYYMSKTARAALDRLAAIERGLVSR